MFIQILYFFTGAIFVLNMDAFRLREDQGPQTVSVLLSNGVQLATNVEVLFTTQDGTAVGMSTGLL